MKINGTKFRGGPVQLAKKPAVGERFPVKLLARTPAPVTVPRLGRVVHDLDGLQVHKSRLCLDYDHDPMDAIGMVNKFAVDPKGLWAEGWLYAHKEHCCAREVADWLKAGVPLECSIAAETVEKERLHRKKVAFVNGVEIEGPLWIVRKWRLRGVAVTLYGADATTNVELLGAKGGNLSRPAHDRRSQLAPVVGDSLAMVAAGIRRSMGGAVHA